MKINKIVLIGLLFFQFFGTAAIAQNWYKGNLHTHSLWSDGDDFPEMIAHWYKSNGYNFLGITDHNRLQAGENWRTVPSGLLTKEGFERYSQRFGEKNIDVNRQENNVVKVRLKTLDEYQSQFNEDGRFLLLNGEEITSSYSGQPLHVNAINIREVVPRQYGNNTPDVLQHAVHSTLYQRKKTGQKMFPILNHPNFGRAYTALDIMKVQHVRFFEVFNGGFPTGNYGDDKHDSTEVIWDKVNLHFIKEGRPLLFGIGNDDSHNYHSVGASLHNPGRAWVMVNAPKLEGNAIVEAMEAGHFYATTGVILKELVANEKKIALKVQTEADVVYTIQFIGVRKGSERATLLKEVTGTEAEYQLTKDDLFVRAKIMSSKLKENPYAVGDFETAWTQPVSRFAVKYSEL